MNRLSSLYKALKLRFYILKVFLRIFFVNAFSNKDLHYNMINYLNYLNQLCNFQNLLATSNIKTVAFEELFGPLSESEINLESYEHDGVTMTSREITYLCAMAQITESKKIFEFGTYKGFTTLQLALNTTYDSLITTINISKEEVQQLDDCTLDIENGYYGAFDDKMIGEEFKNHEASRKIKQLIANSYTHDFSPYYNSIDLVFIDASHKYKYVERDSEHAYKMIKNGGVIVWHDFRHNTPEVVQYLVNMSKKKQIYHIEGTALAVHQRHN